MKRFSNHRSVALYDVGRPTRWGEYRDWPQLQAGQFISVMHRVDVDSRELSDRMCAVQLPNQECLILVLSEFVHDDGVIALRIAMEQAGMHLAVPGVVTVPAPVLSMIARQSRIDRQGAPLSGVHGIRAPSTGHVLLSVLDDILLWALRQDATDIHIGVYRDRQFADIAFSIRGSLVRPSAFASLSVDLVRELLSVVWMRVDGGNGAVFEPQREQQGRLERTVAATRVSMRWASMASQKGPCVTLRLLQRECHASRVSLEQLGYSTEQLQALYRARLATGGAVLLAGAVGSGKSTTLAAIIRGLPASRKVITLEDPVEFDLPNAIQCAITAFGDGLSDHERFDVKLQALKRSAANDVLIGEIRDPGSARALTDLLLAGTNVYSTIHAGSALQIIPRLCSPALGIASDLLAVPGVIKLLAYQVLLNRLCQSCCHGVQQWIVSANLRCALGLERSAREASAWVSDFERRYEIPIELLRFRNLDGCGSCRTLRRADRAQPEKGDQEVEQSHTPGYQRHLMAAEFIEPGRVAGFTAWIRAFGAGASHPEDASLAVTLPPSDATASSMALSHVRSGLLDPRDFEFRFGRF